jgi:hypothetical protein
MINTKQKLRKLLFPATILTLIGMLNLGQRKSVLAMKTHKDLGQLLVTV